MWFQTRSHSWHCGKKISIFFLSMEYVLVIGKNSLCMPYGMNISNLENWVACIFKYSDKNSICSHLCVHFCISKSQKEFNLEFFFLSFVELLILCQQYVFLIFFIWSSVNLTIVALAWWICYYANTFIHTWNDESFIWPHGMNVSHFFLFYSDLFLSLKFKCTSKLFFTIFLHTQKNRCKFSTVAFDSLNWISHWNHFSVLLNPIYDSMQLKWKQLL